MSKLSRYCEGVMEAAWLAGLAVVPVLLDVMAYRGMQDKAVVLRCLALVTVAAMLVKTAESGRRDWSRALRSFFRAPLAIPLAMLALAWLLATVFSIDPLNSLWGGGAGFPEGSFTAGCYLVVLAAVALYLRRPDQRERLVTTIIAASLPVAVYGILQGLNKDPMHIVSDDSSRVSSTIGQAVFMGAYLCMVLPLVCGRFLSVMRSSGGKDGKWSRRLAMAGYVLLATTQFTALILTQSRGPMLGLCAGLGIMFCLWAAYHNRRRLLVIPFGLAGVALVSLMLLRMLAHAPGGGQLPQVWARYAAALSPSEGGPFRQMMWQEAPKVIFAGNALPFPTGGHDHFHAIRPFVGYGPENLSGVVAHEFSDPTAPFPRLEERFHNLIWDTWAGIGGLGVVAFLACFVQIFQLAYRRLGWLATRRQTFLFWLVLAACVAAGITGFSAWQGIGFAGLGLQGGMVAGLAIFPLIAKRQPREAGRKPELRGSEILAIALLSALAAHMIETGFSFEVTASAALYWTYFGVLLAILRPSTSAVSDDAQAERAGPGQNQAPVNEAPTGVSVGWRGSRSALASAIITSLILVTLLFDFVIIRAKASVSTWDVLSRSLTETFDDHRVWTTVFMFVVAWIGAAYLLSNASAEKNSGRRHSTWLALAVSAPISLAYAVVKAWQISANGPIPWASDPDATAIARCVGYENIYLTYVAIMLAMVLIGGVLLCAAGPGPAGPVSGKGLAAGALLFPGALVACYSVTTCIRAEISFRWAHTLDDNGLTDAATVVFARAARLSPTTSMYQISWGDSAQGVAGRAAETAGALDRMLRAEQILRDAVKPPALNRNALALGTFYFDWALKTPAGDEQRALAEKARHAFDLALLFEPNTEAVWTASADLDQLFLDPKRAESENRTARALFVPGNAVSFANYYTAKGLATSNPELKKIQGRRADDYLQAAVAEAKAAGTPVFDLLVDQGSLRTHLMDPQAALASYEEALKEPPTTNRWRAEAAAAGLYFQLGDRTNAIEHVKFAIQAAPDDKRATLAQFQREFEQNR